MFFSCCAVGDVSLILADKGSENTVGMDNQGLLSGVGQMEANYSYHKEILQTTTS